MISPDRLAELIDICTPHVNIGLEVRAELRKSLLELLNARTRITEQDTQAFADRSSSRLEIQRLHGEIEQLRKGLSQEDRDACLAGATALIGSGQSRPDYFEDPIAARNERLATILRRLGGQTT